jgi:nucleotide-binding universal stress UspA family protein
METLPTYRRILCATDGSDLAHLAGLHAIALALKTGAELHLLAVVDTHGVFRLGIHAAEGLHELRGACDAALERLAAVARAHGLEPQTELAEGRPGPTIVRIAQELGVDLIVLGARGESALEAVIVGSVSQYVLAHARQSVLVVHPPEGS